jgi:outer membrane protein assembly factor BamB
VIDAHSKTWRIGLPLVLACGVVVAWSCSGGPADDAGSAGPGPRELTGTWSGELSHNAQTAPFAIRFDTTEEGDLEALVSIPDSDLWEASFGEAMIEENEIRIGSWALTYDPKGKTLTGQLPATLVPIYSIPVTLTRADPLERIPRRAISAPTAEPLWTFATEGPIWGGVAFVDGVVYAGSDDGTLVAVDGRSGELLWRFATDGAIHARPTVVGDHLFIPSDDGHLYKLESKTGEKRWSARILDKEVARVPPGEAGSRYDPYASEATVDRHAVYVGSPDGNLYALDNETGRQRWKFGTGDSVVSTPVVADERVITGSFDGYVYAVEAKSGKLAWKHDTKAPVVSSPALIDGSVVIGSRSYDLLALDAADGGLRWKYYCWFSWIESSATVRDAMVYIGSSDAAKLFAIDATDGRAIWQFDTGGWSWAQPAVTDAAVYIGSVGVTGYMFEHVGGFVAVNRADGKALWQYPVQPQGDSTIWGFGSSPAAGDELVFVGGLDGKLYAFAQSIPGQ